MPAALLSRFDLIFILLDTYDFDKDTELSRHIGNVHKLGRAPVEDNEVFSPEFIRAYVGLSK